MIKDNLRDIYGESYEIMIFKSSVKSNNLEK